MDELYDEFIEKTDYLTETKGLLKDRINSLGGSITSGTTFRDYLVWLDSLYEALEEKTITGLPDSLEGKCEQTGTPTPDSPVPINITTGRQVVSVCGKNLANIDNIQIGKTWSNQSNAQRATILYIPVKAGQQYSLVSSYTNENITQIRGVLNKGANDQTNNLVINGTFTNDSNWTYISIEVIANTTFTSSMLDGVKIMLCKGTATINDYEEYKGNDYEINLGKNKVNALDTSSMINFTKIDDVFKTSALTSTGYGGIASMTFTNSTPIMKNGVGYFSADIRLVSGTTSAINVIGDKSLTRTNAGWVSNQTLSNEFQRYCYKYDVSMGTSFTGFMIQLYNCNNAIIEVKNIMFSYSSDLDYSPYKTPIYLGKIGTYQDYIFRNTTENPLYDSNLEEGQWYIHKEIGRVVLNGSESWGTNQIGTNTTAYNLATSIDAIATGSNNIDAYVSHFKGIANGYNVDEECFWFNQTGLLRLRINKTTASNVSNFKTWLSSHNVEVYYVLNTPTTTLIEDEELINQLNEIEIFTVISEDFYN